MLVPKKYSVVLILKLRRLLQNHELHKKAKTAITDWQLHPLVAGFCFHDHETQPKPSIKHFSRALYHGSLRALLYTVFLHKYNESIGEYETLD